MENYRFTTKHPIATNEETMSAFLNDHFYQRFDGDSYVIKDNGTMVEVENGIGELWAVHAGGDGDFCNHLIVFEKL